MKMHLWLFAMLLMFSSAISAQTDVSYVIVVAVKGKVKYQSPNLQKSIVLNPGAVVSMDGSIELRSGDKVLVLVNDEFIQIQGNGIKNLRKVIESFKSKPVINFDTEFKEYINAAIQFKASVNGSENYGNVIDPKRGGDGWAGITPAKGPQDGWGGITSPKGPQDAWGGITSPKGPQDAWGEGEVPIQSIVPHGYLVVDFVMFRWSGPARIKMYTIDILGTDGSVIHSFNSKKTSAEVDLKSLKLAKSETYSWRVYPSDIDQADEFVQTRFTITERKDQDAAMRKALKSRLGAATDPSLKSMMEAVALEKAEYYTAALEKYETALAEDPKNDMLRTSYSAFLKRRNFEAAAQKVLTDD